jgi:hypothetical protein
MVYQGIKSAQGFKSGGCISQLWFIKALKVLSFPFIKFINLI